MNLKSILAIVLFILLLPFRPQAESSQIDSLNKIIQTKAAYDSQKKARIDLLEKTLDKIPLQDIEAKYRTYLTLYEEYKTFEFNKAFFYIKKVQQLAEQQNNAQRLSSAKLKLAFILVSSGMFKESLDALSTVDSTLLDINEKIDLYILLARNYYDLADYTKDEYYAPEYIEFAGASISKALALAAPTSFNYKYYLGLKLLKEGQIDHAQELLSMLLKTPNLGEHQKAIITSTLSDIFIQRGKIPEAIDLLAIAASSDIKSSTKEAAAMLNLSLLLFQRKDLKHAYLFINEAMDDANFYGARQRKLQVSANLKIIATGKVNSVDDQRRVMTRFTVALSALSLIIIVFVIVFYRQLLKIRKADAIIRETNSSLNDTINKLHEADKIKEEYVSYYFNINSEYIDKLEHTKKSIENKLKYKEYEDIKLIIGKINPPRERQNLYLQFDKTFLRIFPNFIQEFNLLFKAEDHFHLPENGGLNTELRIFALIRMGITDNNTIAQILDYSINTIYTYKNRIKNKAIVPNNEFEDYIIKIKGL